ncbi:lipolytic enzyme [Streptomyces sp. WAC 05379]|nr:lipolytic enzyme [Streptomyces sp. WAC 05379]
MRPLRYVALGDSLTEGVGDPAGNGWRGWAALLAGGLSEPSAEFTNLAVSGAQTRDVLETQLPAALELRPDVASVLVGVNDTLRSTFDIEKIAQRLDKVYESFTRQGTAVLTACLPDPGTMLGLPGVLGNPLARRQRAVNTVVHTLSERYGAVHLHAVDDPWIMDRAMWSSDRLHPGERGHRQIALRFHAMLRHRGIGTEAAPAAEPEFPPPTKSASLLWLATAGTAWVIRRCNDLLPQLVRLAAVEMRHRARGTSDRLDVRAALSVSRALAALSAPGPMALAEQRLVAEPMGLAEQRLVTEPMGLPEQRLVTEPMGLPEHLPLPEGLSVSDPRLVPEHRPLPDGLTVPVPGQRSVPEPQPAPEAA